MCPEAVEDVGEVLCYGSLSGITYDNAGRRAFFYLCMLYVYVHMF